MAPAASSADTPLLATDKPRKPVVWEDLNTGKFHAINNETGEKVPCDRDGRPMAQFHLDISGIATTKARLGLVDGAFHF